MNAARTLRAEGQSRFVILCDHASNHIPPELHNLGLSALQVTRHIAWDIGAAGIAETLSELLDAPAFLSGASRLVIDCNRQLASPELIPLVAHGTPVPGNAELTTDAVAARVQSWFRPYHDAIESVLAARAASRRASIIIAIHSMTPFLDGELRPWQIAVSSYGERRLIESVLAALRVQGDLVVGDNEPYCIEPDIDYSIPFHAVQRGLMHLQVEFRQDEVSDARAQRRWALRLAEVLTNHSRA